MKTNNTAELTDSDFKKIKVNKNKVTKDSQH